MDCVGQAQLESEEALLHRQRPDPKWAKGYQRQKGVRRAASGLRASCCWAEVAFEVGKVGPRGGFVQDLWCMVWLNM